MFIKPGDLPLLCPQCQEPFHALELETTVSSPSGFLIQRFVLRLTCRRDHHYWTPLVTIEASTVEES